MNGAPDARPDARVPAASWLPPAVLAAVAATQLVFAHTTPLSPWKGGGFGMFATSDSAQGRFFEADGLARGGQAVRVGIEFAPGDRRLPSDLLNRVHAYPNRADLEHIARTLLAAELVPDRGAYRLPRPGEVVPPGVGLRLERVRLRLWRKRLDLAAGVLRAERIGPELTLDAGP